MTNPNEYQTGDPYQQGEPWAPQPPPPGYSQQPGGGYPQAPTSGYPASPGTGYPQQPGGGYPPHYPTTPYPDQRYPAQGYPAQPYMSQSGPGQPYSDVPPQLLFDPAAGAPYAPPPKRMSTGVKILLWVIPIALIAGIAGVAVALTTGNDNKPKAAAAKNTPPVVTPTPKSATGLDTFTFPKTLLGLPKSTNPQLLDAAKAMQDMLAHAAAGTTTATVYQSPSDPTDVILVTGVPDVISSPSAYAQNTYTGMKTTLSTLTPKHTYPAGSMGGVLWCSDATLPSAGNLKVAVCDVTDTGGSLLVFYYSHSSATLVKDMPAFRSTIETR